MSKRDRISAEEVEAILQARRKNKDKTVDKWLEVLQLRAEGKNRAEISNKTGFSKQYVTELASEYRKRGLEEFAKKQYKGNRRNLSVSEEQAFLEPYKQQAIQGQLVEVGAMRKAYEAKVGHTIGGSQIYRVLHRHGWRKVMPRSKHPNKAGDEAIEASKKLTQPSGTRWQILPTGSFD